MKPSKYRKYGYKKELEGEREEIEGQRSRNVWDHKLEVKSNK